MFVRDFIHVEQPFQEIAPRFLRDPRWLAPIVDTAITDAFAVTHATGGAPCGATEPRADGSVADVRFDRGVVRSRPGGIVLPIAWSALAPSRPFPAISGDLEVAPIGLHRSEIVLSARYQDPVQVEHHVVEAAVRAFLQALAATLEAGRPE